MDLETNVAATKKSVTNALTKLRIWMIKRSLRNAYITYRDMLDNSRAGRHMTDQLPSVSAQKARCNALLSQLVKLDPKGCPITHID